MLRLYLTPIRISILFMLPDSQWPLLSYSGGSETDEEYLASRTDEATHFPPDQCFHLRKKRPDEEINVR